MAQYVLEILDGERAGEVVRLSDRLRIGRKPVNDLVINDEKTSGVHAEVVLEGDRHVLRDLGSTNGTLMDGKKLSEVVLTPGDIFQAGRVRLCFRSEGGAAAATGGEEGLTLHRVDQAKLQRAGRGRSVWLLAAVGVLVLAVVAWRFLGTGAESASGGGKKARPPMEVAGNRLPGTIGACEEEQGWVLRGAGSGFAAAADGHTGTGRFEALRAAGEGAPDFAVARLQEPLTVPKDRPFTLAAHVRTEHGGLAGVRLRFFAAAGNAPVFRTGTKLEAHEGWQRIVCTAAVPAGADRLEVELVAVLPDAKSAVMVDDVALTEDGDGKPVELKAETGQRVVGTGGAVAVTSTDPEQPVIVYGVLPEATVPLQGLIKAGFGCLSDLGQEVGAEQTERGFALVAKGGNSLTLEVPADAAAGLLKLNGRAFEGTPPEGEFRTAQMLLGDRLTRCLIVLAEETAVASRPMGSRHRLSLQAGRCELMFGFRGERQAAQALLKEAQQQASAEPGKALDNLRKLQQELPHDTETLRQAQTLRSEVQQRMAERLQLLARDLDEAEFFDTRGGFDRVVQGIDEVTVLFGRNNLEDAVAVDKMRAEADGRRAALDGSRTADAKKRLQDLEKLLSQSGQAELAKLVHDYLARGKDPGSNGGK